MTVQTRRQFVRSTAALAAGGSAAFLAACGGSDNSSSSSKSAASGSGSKTASLKYGSGFAVGTVLAYSDSLMADYAKKRGVDVKVAFYEPNVIRTVLASGRAGFINFSPLTTLGLVDQGTEARVVAHTQPISDYVIVVDSTKIKSVQDLAGKKFGTSGDGTISSLIPQVAVEQKGGDWSKVQQVLIEGSTARLAALLAGKIDATALYHDAAYAANIQNPRYKLLLDTADSVPQIFASIQTTPKYIDENRDAIVQMLAARAESMKAINDDPEAFVAGYMKANPKAVRKAVEKANQIYVAKHQWDPDLKILPDVLTATMKLGVEQAKPPLAPKEQPLDKWVDSSLRDEAIQKLGGEGWWK